MKKLLLSLSCAALIAGLGTPAASADVFAYSFSGVDTGSGTFTATLLSPGEYLITGMNGTIDGSSVMALLPAGSYPASPLAQNDNLLFYPAVSTQTLYPASYLDVFGVSFVLGSLGDYNIYFGQDFAGDPYVYNLFFGSVNNTTNDMLSSFTLTDLTQPAATPEPNSLILLGTGALGVLGALRRRHTSAI